MVERIELENGIILYKNDDEELHREDGPAVIRPDGTKFWCLNGEIYSSFNDWIEELDKNDEEKMGLILYYG